MLNFDDRTYANILAEQLDRVTNTIDKREGSIIQTALGPASWTIEGIYMNLAQLQLNGFALYAVGEALDYKTEERGIFRNPATAAHRRGEFNVEVPNGARFQTIDGANSVVFYVSAPLTSTNEYFHYEVICETTGNIGNSYSGSLLPITAVSGLTYAQLTEIIIPGTDEEDDESLRQRYIVSLEEQAFAGNIAAYETTIGAQPGIGAVQVYPHTPTAGYVLCSIIDANYNPATPAVIETIQMLICPPDVDQNDPSANGYGYAPIGAIVNITTATELDINVTMTLTLQSEYSISTVQTNVENAISAYLLEVRRNWAHRTVTNTVEYLVYVYISRIIVNVLQVEGVINATNVTVNGDTEDLQLTENGTVQQLPVLGTVTLSEG